MSGSSSARITSPACRVTVIAPSLQCLCIIRQPMSLWLSSRHTLLKNSRGPSSVSMQTKHPGGHLVLKCDNLRWSTSPSVPAAVTNIRQSGSVNMIACSTFLLPSVVHSMTLSSSAS